MEHWRAAPASYILSLRGISEAFGSRYDGDQSTLGLRRTRSAEPQPRNPKLEESLWVASHRRKAIRALPALVIQPRDGLGSIPYTHYCAD